MATKKAKIQVTVMSIGNKVLTNVNDTEYRIVNIEYTNKKGETKVSSAICYETNIPNLTQGLVCDAEAIMTEGNKDPLIVVTGFVTSRASAEDFDFEEVEDYVPETSKAKFQAAQ